MRWPMTTMGQLISELFSKYERKYRDEELAALATQVALDDILRARRRAAKRSRVLPARLDISRYATCNPQRQRSAAIAGEHRPCDSRQEDRH